MDPLKYVLGGPRQVSAVITERLGTTLCYCTSTPESVVQRKRMMDPSVDLKDYTVEEAYRILVYQLEFYRRGDNPYTDPFCRYVATSVPLNVILMAQSPYPNTNTPRLLLRCLT